MSALLVGWKERYGAGAGFADVVEYPTSGNFHTQIHAPNKVMDQFPGLILNCQNLSWPTFDSPLTMWPAIGHAREASVTALSDK